MKAKEPSQFEPNPNFPKPTGKLVKQYITKFSKDDRLAFTENAINRLIKYFPYNKDIDSVLLKTTVINSLYNTNLYSTIDIAKHIIKQNFDEAILKGDKTIVDSIASGHGIFSKRTGKEYRFYSFATKYCSWHDQINYPIYDSYIDMVLKYYHKIYDYNCNKNYKIYENLIQTLKLFIETHELENFTLKEIDKFLWYMGKDSVSSK